MCSWLEDLSRRHAEVVASRMSADKMRQQVQVLSAENEKLKVYLWICKLKLQGTLVTFTFRMIFSPNQCCGAYSRSWMWCRSPMQDI